VTGYDDDLFADQYELITDTSDIYTVNKEDFLPNMDLPSYITATVINKHILRMEIRQPQGGQP